MVMIKIGYIESFLLLRFIGKLYKAILLSIFVVKSPLNYCLAGSTFDYKRLYHLATLYY